MKPSEWFVRNWFLGHSLLCEDISSAYFGCFGFILSNDSEYFRVWYDGLIYRVPLVSGLFRVLGGNV